MLEERVSKTGSASLRGLGPSGPRATCAIVRRHGHGLTLTETLALLAVLAAFVALAVPIVLGMLRSGRRARVRHELNAIALGVAAYARDVGYYPGAKASALPRLTVLCTEGRFPAAAGVLPPGYWHEATQIGLADYLVSSAASPQDRWAGPYLNETIGPDAWGHAYLINISDGGRDPWISKRAVFVLSAGPNGVIETHFNQPVGDALLGGDDQWVRIE